jgi:hypothetical protein
MALGLHSSATLVALQLVIGRFVTDVYAELGGPGTPGSPSSGHQPCRRRRSRQLGLGAPELGPDSSSLTPRSAVADLVEGAGGLVGELEHLQASSETSSVAFVQVSGLELGELGA